MNREFRKHQEGRENMENAKIQSPETELLLASYEGTSIHNFLYTLSKKPNICSSHDDRSSEIQFKEGEAIILCEMLRREGFFEDIVDEPGCTVCATEKLEKHLMDTMQSQLDATRMAREYYAMPENMIEYNICVIHRPFNPKDCIPNMVNDGPQPNGAYFGPQVMSNVPNYLNVVPSSNFVPASNFNVIDYFANQAAAEYEAQALIPSYFAGQTLNSLFPNMFNDPACQLQYSADSKFFPKDSNIRGTSNDFSSLASGSNNNFPNHIDSFDNTNHFVPTRPIAQSGAPNNIPVQTSGQNVFVNHSNRAMNGFQNVTPPNNIQNNVEKNLHNLVSRANNSIYQRSLAVNQNSNHVNQGVALNPRLNPARQQLINNAISNFTADMHDEILRGNRVGRKIVGKRY